MVSYARVLVEVTVMKKAPKYIHFEDEKGIIQQQEIVFEWEPMICDKCKKCGHDVEHCKYANRYPNGPNLLSIDRKSNHKGRKTRMGIGSLLAKPKVSH